MRRLGLKYETPIDLGVFSQVIKDTLNSDKITYNPRVFSKKGGSFLLPPARSVHARRGSRSHMQSGASRRGLGVVTGREGAFRDGELDPLGLVAGGEE